MKKILAPLLSVFWLTDYCCNSNEAFSLHRMINNCLFFLREKPRTFAVISNLWSYLLLFNDQ